MRLWKNAGAKLGAIAALGTLLAFQACAQDDQVKVPFGDASKPRTLVVNLLNGGMTIHGGASGNEAIIEGSGSNSRHSSRESVQGMHRIDSGNNGYDVTEENNVVTVH